MKHVKWARAVWAGFLANLASFVVGGGGYLLFGRVFKLDPVSVWRWTPEKMWEMSIGWWVYLCLGNTGFAILCALGYAVLYHGIPGKGWRKGAAFGVIIWFTAVLPIMFTVHALTLINDWAILYFTTQALLEFTVYGAIIAAVYGQPKEELTTNEHQ